MSGVPRTVGRSPGKHFGFNEWPVAGRYCRFAVLVLSQNACFPGPINSFVSRIQTTALARPGRLLFDCAGPKETYDQVHGGYTACWSRPGWKDKKIGNKKIASMEPSGCILPQFRKAKLGNLAKS